MKAVLFDPGDTLVAEKSAADIHYVEAKLQEVPFVEKFLKELARFGEEEREFAGL